MLSQDVILGFCATIGGIVFMFNRFGWIKLGKTGNNNKVITEIRTLSDVQIVQGQILKTREKMSQAKKRNPVKFWLGKGDLLRKAVQELTSRIPEYLRTEILERDNNRCVRCDSPKRPHVHHLDGRDGRVNTIDPPNHSHENLITLCPKCHENIHKNHIQAIKGRWPEDRSRKLACKECGKVFITSKWEVDRGRKYCSRRCCSISKTGRKLPRKSF